MKETDVSIASHYPKEASRLKILLGITFLLLCVGLVSPIITLKTFVLFKSTFSVLSGTIELLKHGQIFLFIVIAGFSVVLPVLKIGVLIRLLSAKKHTIVNLDTYLHWMHVYGRWSMLDVFVVAVLIVSVKLGTLANVEIRYGLYAFAAAVLLTMYITSRVVSLTDRSKKATLQADQP